MRRVLAATALIMFLWVSAPVAHTQTNLKDQKLGPPRYSPSSSLSQSLEPEDGHVANGLYANEYFQLAFPLLAGWQEDMKGPIPSATGYYSLSALRTQGELRGTVFIDAQDIFFSSFAIHNAMEFAQRREHQAAYYFQDVIEHAPQEIKLARHQFARLDYSGAGYHHAVFSTVIRCHVVSIDIASRFPEVFQKLDQNMDHISLLNIADPAAGGGSLPVCAKDYVSDATVIHKVNPVMVGPRFTRVPARFVIDKEGRVKHIHVINALPDQARSVEEALAQWVFKPYFQNGQAVEVETGIIFDFPPKDQKQNTVVSSSY